MLTTLIYKVMGEVQRCWMTKRWCVQGEKLVVKCAVPQHLVVLLYGGLYITTNQAYQVGEYDEVIPLSSWSG